MGRDLRWYIGELKKYGELVEIWEEVDWYLEAAAITTMLNRVGGPRPWFRKIRGYPEGYSIFGDLASGTWKAPWKRIAIMAGAPPEIWDDYIAIQDEALRRLYSRIKPITVTTGECKEEIHIGDEVNVLEFPWPYVHMGDGGRYGTVQTWCVKDPDSPWVNWGQYRLVVHTKNAIGTAPVIGTHMHTIVSKYHERGEPAPVACFIGSNPMCFVGSAYSAPAGFWEAENIGGLMQEPLELVKCETVDLYVPADAEIVIEGEIRPGELWDEGPFGEYVGFTEGPRLPRWVVRVRCITHRKDPILPMAVEGTRLTSSQAISFAMASEIWRRLRVYHDFPVRGVFISLLAPWNFHIVSTEKPYPGYLHRLVSEYFTEKTSAWWGRLCICDAKVEPTDMDYVLEEWALNTNPATDIHITDEDVPAIPYQPFLSLEEKKRGFMAHVWFDATDKTGERRVSWEDSVPEEVKAKVRKLWEEVGMSEKLEERRREYTIRPSIRDVIE